jgi:hypothetical protein
VGEDGISATRLTQVGIYIEVLIDPTLNAVATRISQAFVLVEARRTAGYAAVRISQAFVLVEARRSTRGPFIPPDAGEILDRLPPYQQLPPVPLDRTQLPPPAQIHTIEAPALPDQRPPQPVPAPYQQEPPVPFRPLQWFSQPIMQPIDMPPLPEAEPMQPGEFPSRGRGDILGITRARVSRSNLVDALAATLDAQSTPVTGAAVGPNLAMIHGVPAQTTETAPVAGRTASYVNIGRASKAIYTPEAQTPAARKASSATDTAPAAVVQPANPATRIDVFYPLLGGGALTSDISIALDETGYRQAIAAVLDAIMQATVTIGYEEGSEPETIRLYVIPGAYDAATLDGLTVADLLLVGSAEGQIMRYNENVGQWRTASEPLSLAGVALAANNPPTQHGGFRYNPLTGHLEMLVDID